MIRVIVIEDETLVREGLVAIVAASGDIEVVGTAADGVEALDLVATAEPDVVLMDIRMPRLDGIAATARLSEQGSAARVLVLTTVETDEALLGALRAGAAGFVLKSSPRVELWHAIRTLADGGMLLSPAITQTTRGAAPCGPGAQPSRTCT